MIKERFTIADGFKIVAIRDNDEIMNSNQVCDKLNEFYEENQYLRQILDLGQTDAKSVVDVLNMQQIDIRNISEENKELKHHIKNLEREVHLEHMRSMFSTVKSFNGDVSKRYYYSEETDTLYDSANNYGQYDKILDKKEVAMLLNEYETLLNNND